MSTQGYVSESAVTEFTFQHLPDNLIGASGLPTSQTGSVNQNGTNSVSAKGPKSGHHVRPTN